MRTDVEIAIVGAGVVGVAIAAELARRGRDVLLIERHGRAGTETSSRSSEVIHAGLYYPAGSLRARLCVEGRQRLYRFADENGVPVLRSGKLVVATATSEMDRLAAIAASAAGNGVDDVVRLTGAEAIALEPDLACVGALLSPSTGVIDSHALITALEGHFATAGGTLALNTHVTGLSRTEDDAFAIDTNGNGATHRLTAERLILAGGLGATRLGAMLAYRDGYRPPETYPAKGHYFVLKRRAPFRHLIYPVPQDAWLGIHLTLDTGGHAKFGPDLEWTETPGYAFEHQDGARMRRFEREIRRYWPGLPNDALDPGHTALRPKIYREGEAAADFAIHARREHGHERLVALYGIESPGLTASLAIAAHVAAMVESE